MEILYERIIFHHDKISMLVHLIKKGENCEKLDWKIIRHLSYSPDLAPSGFFLIPNLENTFERLAILRLLMM